GVAARRARAGDRFDRIVQDARFHFRAEILAELIPACRADAKAGVVLDLDSGPGAKEFLHVGLVRDFRPDAPAKIKPLRTVSAAGSLNREQWQKTRQQPNAHPNHRLTICSHMIPPFLVSPENSSTSCLNKLDSSSIH